MHTRGGEVRKKNPRCCHQSVAYKKATTIGCHDNQNRFKKPQLTMNLGSSHERNQLVARKINESPNTMPIWFSRLTLHPDRWLGVNLRLYWVPSQNGTFAECTKFRSKPEKTHLMNHMGGELFPGRKPTHPLFFNLPPSGQPPTQNLTNFGHGVWSFRADF